MKQQSTEDNTLNKADLTSKIVTQIGGTKAEADRHLTAAINIIMEIVASGQKVSLVGFGTFEGRDRQERQGRNPKTGETIAIPAKTVPVFSPGKEFKEKVSNG